MSLLDHPEAQAILADATLSPEAVRGCQGRLTAFLQRYLPRFYRSEHREHAARVVGGLLSGLGRKTWEPIAYQAGLPRKPIQSFVGSGKWDDEAVMAELRAQAREELADEQAILILDPSAVPKKGTQSCGVQRQWCGRPGKQDNCPLGVFPADAAPGGSAPLDRQLYLPEEWADDPERREKCHVPEEVEFRETWRIAADLLRRGGADLPHAWVVGDDEFGRPSEFRAWRRRHGERSVLDVPCNTTIRDLERRRPRRRRAGRGRKREVPFVRVDARARRQPDSRWTRLTVRSGEQGPSQVDAMMVRVRAELGRRIGPEERLLVTRSVAARPRVDYSLSNAGAEGPLAELVRVRSARHRIEELFEAGKGEAGRGHYEVRSWVGWHHHMTLALLALWFLCCERRAIGGETPGDHGVAGAGGHDAVAASPGPEPRGDRPRGVAGVAAHRGVPDLQVVQVHGEVPSPAPTAGFEPNNCPAV